MYNKGATIGSTGAQVVKVTSKRVYIKNGNRNEYVELDGKTAARFVPSIKDGKPNGFKLYAIRPQSIFGRIGLQNGDTIKAINGSEMTTPDAALGLYTKLRNASHLSVQVERRGETVTLDYSIR
jgi:type II secretory pathway component PulC